MKVVKSLLLGTAAGLIAVGGAQAADLPVKAKAVEYVKICSLYGAGFYYIPGTDTCIKLGGYLRAEVALNTNNANLNNGISLYGASSGSVNPTDGGTSGGSLGVYYAFIQFAGFTMGKAVSQFDAPWVSYPGNNFDSLVGG